MINRWLLHVSDSESVILCSKIINDQTNFFILTAMHHVLSNQFILLLIRNRSR